MKKTTQIVIVLAALAYLVSQKKKAKAVEGDDAPAPLAPPSPLIPAGAPVTIAKDAPYWSALPSDGTAPADGTARASWTSGVTQTTRGALTSVALFEGGPNRARYWFHTSDLSPVAPPAPPPPPQAPASPAGAPPGVS
jgi:hypothetical protein